MYFAARDHESWPKDHCKVLVDPYSPFSYKDALSRDRNAQPFVCFADASYWHAIGTHNAWHDGTVRYSDMGCWVNAIEKQIAYEDTEFWTELHARKRTAALDQDVTTYELARRRPARAYSRGPSRGPGGRRGRP